MQQEMAIMESLDHGIPPEMVDPLTTMRSLSQILKDHPELEEAKRQEFLRIILKESERLIGLIQDWEALPNM